MNDSLLLGAEATVQEIQLELIRRTRFNAFDGELDEENQHVNAGTELSTLDSPCRADAHDADAMAHLAK